MQRGSRTVENSAGTLDSIRCFFKPCEPTALRKSSVVGEHQTQRNGCDFSVFGHAQYRFSQSPTVDIVPPHQLVNIDEVSPTRVCTPASDCSNDFFRKHHFQ